MHRYLFPVLILEGNGVAIGEMAVLKGPITSAPVAFGSGRTAV